MAGPDGKYRLDEIINVLEDSFKTESELCQYLELNIQQFCREDLGIEYKSHQREVQIVRSRLRVKGNRRMDFVIKSKCGKTIVLECKVPKYGSSLSEAIGQVLTYITLCESTERGIDEFVILSSKLDYSVPLVLSRFNLPITFIALDKKRSLKWLGQ